MGMILCFPGCALFYSPIPDIHFELEDTTNGHSLDILSLEGGRVVRREGNRVTTDINQGIAVVEFEVSSGSRKSIFTCELHVWTGLFYSPFWGVESVSSQDGSLWIPRKIDDTFKISGEHASDAFLLGRSESRTRIPDGDLVIRKEEPNTSCILNSKTLALKCQGRSYTSLAAIDSGHVSGEGVSLVLFARPGSHFLLESEGAVRRVELLDDSSKRVELETGSTTIKWFIPGLDKPQVEVVVDGDKTTNFLVLSFSSGNGRSDGTGS